MIMYFFFFFTDTATTYIYTYGHTLSLHDALPISHRLSLCRRWIICSTSIRGGCGSSALPKATSTARYMSMMPAPPSPNTARMEGCDGQGPDQRKQSASAPGRWHDGSC